MSEDLKGSLQPVRAEIDDIDAQLVERQGALGPRQLLHVQTFQRLQAFKAFQRRIETEIQRLIADRQRFAQVPVMLVEQRRRNVSGRISVVSVPAMIVLAASSGSATGAARMSSVRSMRGA